MLRTKRKKKRELSIISKVAIFKLTYIRFDREVFLFFPKLEEAEQQNDDDDDDEDDDEPYLHPSLAPSFAKVEAVSPIYLLPFYFHFK